MKNDTYSRRSFLQSTATLAAASLMPASQLAAATRSKWRVTCRDQHLAQTKKPDCWTALEFLGADGLEVQVNEELACYSLYHPAQKYSLATADDIKRLDDALREKGKVITAFCMHNKLDERLEQEVEWTRKLAKAAVKLGVDTIRIDVYPRKLTDEEILPFCIKACKQLCEAIKDIPVRLGIENHGKVTNRPDVLQKIFSEVKSSQLGLTLDAMNLYWFGHPLDQVYKICEEFALLAFHTHCKNLRYPEDQRNVTRPMGWEYAKYSAPVYDGDIDFARVAAILRKTGYQSDLCLENECLKHFPAEQQPDVLKKEIAALKKLV